MTGIVYEAPHPKVNYEIKLEAKRVAGGDFFFVKKGEQLVDAYRRIAEELGSQFYLTYSTSVDEWDGRWVKLEVKSDQAGHKARARRGFFAVGGRNAGSPAPPPGNGP